MRKSRVSEKKRKMRVGPLLLSVTMLCGCLETTDLFAEDFSVENVSLATEYESWAMDYEETAGTEVTETAEEMTAGTEVAEEADYTESLLGEMAEESAFLTDDFARSEAVPEATETSGTCGENAFWTLTGEPGQYTLTISGTGRMSDFLPLNGSGIWHFGPVAV